MKVDVEKIPESQVELTVEVEPETVEKYVHRAYRSLVNRMNIPGFRKGKAPRHIVERMVGKEALFQEGVELLLPDVFKQAVEQLDIQPISRPEWEIAQNEPLIVKAKVPVMPNVQLGNYQDIRLDKEHPEVTDEQVESVIERLREQQTQWTPVERPAAMGDTVTVDIEANLKGEALLEGVGGSALVQKSGEQLLNVKGTEYLLRHQENVPFPGLTEQILGLAPGQEKDFELNLPESYPEEQHAGKTANFHVVVHTVKEKHVPELDDELAKTVGEYSSLADLREAVKKEMQERAEADAERRFADAVVQMAVDRSTLEVPRVMVDREAEHSVERVASQIQQQGLSFDQYQKAVNKTREELVEDSRPAAEQHIKSALVLEEIGKAENVSTSSEEIDAEIERMITALGDQAEKARAALNSEEYRHELGHTLRDRKIVKLLTDIASRPDGEDSGATGSEQPGTEGVIETEG